MTEENLLRGKEVFLDRCVGCHGLEGRRQGPGCELPLAAAGRLHRQGRRLLRRRHRARRLLLPHPARLARNGDGELRRPALGRRHLARRPVRQDDPERDADARPRSRAEGLHRLAAVEGAPRLDRRRTRSSTDNVAFDKKASTDPYMQEAMRVFPGLAPGDRSDVNDGRTRRSRCRTRRDGIQRALPRLLEPRLGRREGPRREAAARSQKDDPADRAGAAMRRLLRIRRRLAARRRSRSRRPRSRTTSPRRSSRAG